MMVINRIHILSMASAMGLLIGYQNNNDNAWSMTKANAWRLFADSMEPVVELVDTPVSEGRIPMLADQIVHICHPYEGCRESSRFVNWDMPEHKLFGSLTESLAYPIVYRCDCSQVCPNLKYSILYAFYTQSTLGMMRAGEWGTPKPITVRLKQKI